jgi:hypothetical protein
VGKCSAYLQRGIGLVVVDVVTGRRANLQAELVDLLGQGEAASAVQTDLYATAYRPCGALSSYRWLSMPPTRRRG